MIGSLIIFSINLFFIEGYLLYRILLFSVKPQHESAIGIHTYNTSLFLYQGDVFTQQLMSIIFKPTLVPEGETRWRNWVLFFGFGNSCMNDENEPSG